MRNKIDLLLSRHDLQNRKINSDSIVVLKFKRIFNQSVANLAPVLWGVLQEQESVLERLNVISVVIYLIRMD